MAIGASWGLATVLHEGKPQGCVERDDGTLLPLPGGATVRDLFDEWPAWERRLPSLSGNPLPTGLPRLAPLQYPGKILCAGANYYDHLAEMGVPDTRKEAQRLFFFFKPPRNAVVGPGDTVRYPISSRSFDWEVELACVIGRTARNVSEADALDYVAACTVAIDFSARDLNRAPETFYKLDWVAGKAHDTCCPIGPKLVPRSMLGDVQDLALGLRVNGEVKQDARTSGMIFSVREQIATLSRIMTLDPGDLVLTGTPAGVGAPKGTFLAVGDQVEAWIEGIGTLAVRIQAADA